MGEVTRDCWLCQVLQQLDERLRAIGSSKDHILKVIVSRSFLCPFDHHPITNLSNNLRREKDMLTSFYSYGVT